MAYFEYKKLIGTETTWVAKLNKKVSRAGYLSCFCNQAQINNDNPGKFYTINGLDHEIWVDDYV